MGPFQVGDKLELLEGHIASWEGSKNQFCLNSLEIEFLGGRLVLAEHVSDDRNQYGEDKGCGYNAVSLFHYFNKHT